MKKVKYLIIILSVLFVLFLSNAVINKITNYNIFENISKSFLAIWFEPEEVKSYTLSDENILLNVNAKWLNNSEVEVVFDLSNNFNINDKNKDVVFMIDTSLMKNSVPFQEAYINFISQLLENSNNRISTIMFNNKAKVMHGFSNNIETIESTFDNVIFDEGVNYNDALKKLDELLSTYEEKDDRELMVLFISDSNATSDIKSHKATYSMLKEKYSYLSIDGIMYNSKNIEIKDIKNISDRNHKTDDEEIFNTITNILNNGRALDELILSMKLSNNFNFVGLNSNKGYFSSENNSITWNLNSQHLISGNDKLKVTLRLNSEKQNVFSYYSLNDNTSISYKFNNISDTLTSNESLILKNGFEVSYNLNLPSGCSLSYISSKSYLINSVVELKDDLYCEGYEFLGYKIDNVEMINSKSFIMPMYDVVINASWSNNGMSMELDGVVREKTTLYDVLANANGTLTKKYTGEHKDSYTLPATHDIYHFYAENDTVAASVLNKNNVIFANHCWQMIRTTDTGGVKMIYNGEPDSNGKCGTDRGNHVGYDLNTSINFSMSGEYYYGTDYVYDSSSNMFKISGETKLASWSKDTADSLIGMYTCRLSRVNGTCSHLHLIESYEDDTSANGPTLSGYSHFSSFGYVPFSHSNYSPADFGYKSGMTYSLRTAQSSYSEKITSSTSLLILSLMSNNYWFADSFDYTNNYKLIDAYQISSEEEYSSLIGTYTLRRTTADATSSAVYYVEGIKDGFLYCKRLMGGELTVDSKNLILGDDIVDNGDGTYSLSNPISIPMSDWVINNQNYNYKFTCGNELHVCSNPYFITSTSETSYSSLSALDEILISKSRDGLKLTDTLLLKKYMLLFNKDNYADYKYTCNTVDNECSKDSLRMISSLTDTGYNYIVNHSFGSGIVYDNGIYKLMNPIDLEYTTNSSKLSSHHYMCLEYGETECEEVGYIIHYNSNQSLSYILLKDGQTDVKELLDEMLTDNSKNSLIKTAVDSWYKKYMINYSNYLDDVIYCNNRDYYYYNSSPWNPNGGSVTDDLQMYYSGHDSLFCKNETDQFSISNENAKLDYPVALPSNYEMKLLYSSLIKKTGKAYWTMTPYFFLTSATFQCVKDNGGTCYSHNFSSAGLRPMISLKSGTEYVSGDGSADSPYVIE